LEHLINFVSRNFFLWFSAWKCHRNVVTSKFFSSVSILIWQILWTSPNFTFI
jgi:hypothetical protein